MNSNYFANYCTNLWAVTYRAHMSVCGTRQSMSADGWISLGTCTWFHRHSSVLMNASGQASSKTFWDFSAFLTEWMCYFKKIWLASQGCSQTIRWFSGSWSQARLPAAQTCRHTYSLIPPPTSPILSAQISEAFAPRSLKRFSYPCYFWNGHFSVDVHIFVRWAGRIPLTCALLLVVFLGLINLDFWCLLTLGRTYFRTIEYYLMNCGLFTMWFICNTVKMALFGTYISEMLVAIYFCLTQEIRTVRSPVSSTGHVILQPNCTRRRDAGH